MTPVALLVVVVLIGGAGGVLVGLVISAVRVGAASGRDRSPAEPGWTDDDEIAARFHR